MDENVLLCNSNRLANVIRVGIQLTAFERTRNVVSALLISIAIPSHGKE